MRTTCMSDEAHFSLNGYVNKQNCRIWSEANPQVYVETPLHPEKLTVWCALWAFGIIGPYFFKNDEGHNVTVNGDRYRAMITNFFIPELNNHDVQELWFQQDGATCHTARATIDLLKDTFGDRLISRFGPVNWPARSCDLTPLDYFLWDNINNSKRVVQSPGRSAKVTTEHRHLPWITTLYLVHDDIGGQWFLNYLLVTLLLCLEEEFPGKQSTDAFQRLAFKPGIQSVCPFDCIHQENPGIMELKTSVMNTKRMRHILFSDESKFTRQSDYRGVFFWGKRACLHPSYETKIDRFGGKGILKSGGIMLVSRTSMQDDGPDEGNDQNEFGDLEHRSRVEESYAYANFPLLSALLLEVTATTCHQNAWLMHDGAAAHFLIALRKYLHDTYLRRWIGCGRHVAWPPLSLDLNPLYFFSWDHLKSLVHETSVAIAEDLSSPIIVNSYGIDSTPDMFERIRKSFGFGWAMTYLVANSKNSFDNPVTCRVLSGIELRCIVLILNMLYV
ncbi:transposable element Tc3 transposase [Trichonephila clavipes]|uniref:Transposable element Tc3 transposase n=1 Tax=Trichonephila clavipes TaxID=2585209 RepID=A0A8X6SPB8_TRICX|nr:transposable element Tc3 transposase [Trichonephila clavipes]